MLKEDVITFLKFFGNWYQFLFFALLLVLVSFNKVIRILIASTGSIFGALALLVCIPLFEGLEHQGLREHSAGQHAMEGDILEHTLLDEV